MTLGIKLSEDGHAFRWIEVTDLGPTTQRPIGSNKKAIEAQDDWDRRAQHIHQYQWEADDGAVAGVIVHSTVDGPERLARRALCEYVIQTQIGMIPA